MALRKIIAYLSPEDLKSMADSDARCRVALSGHPGLSVPECVQAFKEDWKLIAYMREKYEVPEDETVDFALYDGAIYEAD